MEASSNQKQVYKVKYFIALKVNPGEVFSSYTAFNLKY